jgi:hypothetical protein
MSFVLAVEPDSTQANILRKILRGRIDAELLVVSTKDAALEAINSRVPDLVLVSTLLPPRDEDGLFAHLRSLDGASHLQTLTIPQLRRRQKPAAQGAFSVFRKKTATSAPTGCDPHLFLQEVESYLARARELRSHPPTASPITPSAPVHINEDVPPAVIEAFAPQPVETFEPVAQSSAFEPVAQSSQFEPVAQGFSPVEIEPVAQSSAFETVAQGFSPVFPSAADSLWQPPAEPAPPPAAYVTHDEPLPTAASDEGWVDLELDRLIQQVGMESTRIEVRERDAELAHAQAEAQAKLAAEIERVQAEAETRRENELARLQAEAEAERVLAINQAREEAEAQARNALAAELARARNDAEQQLAEAELARLNEIKRMQAEADERIDAAARQAREVAEAEAAKAMMWELAKVRADVEQTLNDQLERARAEADRMRAAEVERLQAQATAMHAAAAEEARLAAEAAASRALEAEVHRVRAEAEARLRSELETIRQEAVNMRLAEQSEAKQTAEKVRQAAMRDTRALAEAANHTLESELRRVRAEADARLEAELAKARAEVQHQKEAELEEIRAQVAEMREAAALHVRTAAAEAIASEVARAATEARATAPRVVSAPSVVKLTAAPAVKAKVSTPVAEPRRETVISPVEAESAGGQGSVDYYSLWKNEGTPAAPTSPEPSKAEAPAGWNVLENFKSARAKWAALPVAAALLLMLNGGISIGRGWKPEVVDAQPAAAAVVQAGIVPMTAAPQMGSIQIDVTPAGARVTLDGADAGQAPITLAGIKPGKHTIVLQSSAGMLTRKVTVKPGETSHLTESIFSGWLAVFSGIPLTISIDGAARGTTDDGQVTLSPGTYNVDLVSDRFNYHETKSIKIEPGQVVSYSVKLPVTPVHLDAPEGMEISIDGQSAGTMPIQDLTVPIGTHEISGRGSDGAERRRSIEAKSGEPTEVTLK